MYMTNIYHKNKILVRIHALYLYISSYSNNRSTQLVSYFIALKKKNTCIIES